MKKILILLGLLIWVGTVYSQSGVIRRTQTALVDTLATHIVKANWDIYVASGGGGFADPMTTRGDIIYRNSSNVTDRLAVGTNTYVLTSDGTDVSWSSDLLQNVDNGAKTASFTHDASSASIGAYQINLGTTLTVSIHNLESGMMGTIFMDYVTTSPGSLVVNGYTDAGSTLITEVRENTSAPVINEQTTVTYTYANNGTNSILTLVYGQTQ